MNTGTTTKKGYNYKAEYQHYLAEAEKYKDLWVKAETEIERLHDKLEDKMTVFILQDFGDDIYDVFSTLEKAQEQQKKYLDYFKTNTNIRERLVF